MLAFSNDYYGMIFRATQSVELFCAYPLTACNAMLENMILKIGKYKDYSKYLPECKMMIEELNLMVQNILETTRLNGEGKNIIKEKIKIADFLSEIIVPYEMIAKAKKIHFSVNISSDDEIVTDKNLLRKAISNIISVC